MSSSLWSRLRKARLFQVLLVYFGASWLILQITALLRQEFQLPPWTTPLAILLLLIGLVIVLTTAWVRAWGNGSRVADPDAPGAWELDLDGLRDSVRRGRIPQLTWARAVLGGVVAFSLLFGAAGAYVLLEEREGSLVATDAYAAPDPGIAVLPFRVVGPETELWREGMVDLLSTNLEGIATLRKIDPRAVLSRWRAAFGEGGEPSDPRRALEIARGLGARYALLGSVVASGRQMRLTAEVHDLSLDRVAGRAQVDGSPDSVLTLIDRLSVDLLRGGLVPVASDLPPVDLARVTTSSLPALQSYLQGEQLYRRSRWGEAVPHFARAVELDSTFALAFYRLALSHSWDRGLSSGPGREAIDRAVRLVERLPERERLLITALSQYGEGRLSTLATLERLTARYPDDVEGWYLLGEAYVGVGGKGLHPHDRFLAAHRRTIELSPYFGPAYIHLINDAFSREDSAAVRELLGVVQGIDAESPPCIGFELAYRIAWGDSASRLEAMAALDTAPPPAPG